MDIMIIIIIKWFTQIWDGIFGILCQEEHPPSGHQKLVPIPLVVELTLVKCPQRANVQP